MFSPIFKPASTRDAGRCDDRLLLKTMVIKTKRGKVYRFGIFEVLVGPRGL
jgi:hypothetical protein